MLQLTAKFIETLPFRFTGAQTRFGIPVDEVAWTEPPGSRSRPFADPTAIRAAIELVAAVETSDQTAGAEAPVHGSMM